MLRSQSMETIARCGQRHQLLTQASLRQSALGDEARAIHGDARRSSFIATQFMSVTSVERSRIETEQRTAEQNADILS